MRAMVVRPGASWSVADVAAGWIDGLRICGAEVIDFDLGARMAAHSAAVMVDEDEQRRAWSPEAIRRICNESLVASVAEVRPDVLVAVSGWDIDPWAYGALRSMTRVVIHHTEAPYENDRQAAMADLADVHLVNDPVGIAALRDAGAAEVHYAHHCYRPQVHHPGSGERARRLVFVGSGFAGRRQFMQELAIPAGVGLLLAGTWPEPGDLERFIDWSVGVPCPNEAAADLYRSSMFGLNLYRLDHLERPELAAGWAMGPREVEMAACGLWFARMPRPEGDRLLPMLPRFDSVEECGEVLAWAAAHPEECAAAGEAARAAVADRTFGNLARGLLGLLETKALVAA